MEQLPVWQIIFLVIGALAGVLSLVTQLLIANLIARLNKHSERIDDLTARTIKLEADYKNNIVNHQTSLDDVEDSLSEIKQQLADQGKRFTEFMIDYYKKQGDK